jgi:hypothetical protein
MTRDLLRLLSRIDKGDYSAVKPAVRMLRKQGHEREAFFAERRHGRLWKCLIANHLSHPVHVDFPASEKNSANGHLTTATVSANLNR